jgi:predicted phage terminase large subunit-like protein
MSSPELTNSGHSSESVMSQAERERQRQALYLTTVAENRWLKQQPTGKQAQFLHLDCGEALFGGAAGGGKSSALLMTACQFVDCPGYSALLLRKSYADLALPGALMDRAREWLTGTGATWNAPEHTWRFPSGASVTFGYLADQADKYRYQSSEFQTICFDELTQFREDDYLYLFSRLRRLADSRVPLRMRSASNPGGIGHAWVKRRFLSPEAAQAGRTFVPARLEDNPFLDRDQYTKSLEQLDAFTRRQLLQGDWSEFAGNQFRPTEWPRYFFAGDSYLLAGHRVVRANEVWKFAVVDPATDAKKSSDYTAIGVFGVTPAGDLLVLDMFRRQIDVGDIVNALASVCRQWQPLAFVGMECVAFQKLLVREAAKNPHVPTPLELRPQGKGKLARAVPAIVKGQRKEIHLPQAPADWLDDYVTELAAFVGSGDLHDDMVDVTAYAAIAAQAFRGRATEADRQAGVMGVGYSPTLPLPGHPATGALGFGRENSDYRPLGPYGGLRIFDA